MVVVVLVLLPVVVVVVMISSSLTGAAAAGWHYHHEHHQHQRRQEIPIFRVGNVNLRFPLEVVVHREWLEEQNNESNRNIIDDAERNSDTANNPTSVLTVTNGSIGIGIGIPHGGHSNTAHPNVTFSKNASDASRDISNVTDIVVQEFKHELDEVMQQNRHTMQKLFSDVTMEIHKRRQRRLEQKEKEQQPSENTTALSDRSIIMDDEVNLPVVDNTETEIDGTGTTVPVTKNVDTDNIFPVSTTGTNTSDKPNERIIDTAIGTSIDHERFVDATSVPYDDDDAEVQTHIIDTGITDSDSYVQSKGTATTPSNTTKMVYQYSLDDHEDLLDFDELVQQTPPILHTDVVHRRENNGTTITTTTTGVHKKTKLKSKHRNKVAFVSSPKQNKKKLKFSSSQNTIKPFTVNSEINRPVPLIKKAQKKKSKKKKAISDLTLRDRTKIVELDKNDDDGDSESLLLPSSTEVVYQSLRRLVLSTITAISVCILYVIMKRFVSIMLNLMIGVISTSAATTTTKTLNVAGQDAAVRRSNKSVLPKT